MKLTEEQYKQAARYVDGEMQGSEKESFEALLLQNNNLLEEVEAYKEIRSIGESIEDKISTIEQSIIEKKNTHKEVWRMLEQARERWEQGHEGDLKDPPLFIAPKVPSLQREKAQGKIRGRKMGRRFAAAAVVIGLISLSITWWYQHKEEKDLKITIDQKEQSVKSIPSNKQNTPGYSPNKDTAVSIKVPTSSTTSPVSQAIIAKQNKEQKEKAVRERLVKEYFVRDSLPFEVPDALATPFNFYKDHKDKEAIRGYSKILEDSKALEDDSEVSTRSKNETEQTKFYAHYYLAQSYLSINNTQDAIRELKSAIEESPSLYWKSKGQWYLALAYLKAGQEQKTKGLLKQVKSNDPSGVYREKAIQLNREFKKK
jgi:tetratricopeptide (TPR) repeat protein